MIARHQKQCRFLVGLIGDGIETSLSPALHETEGAALGLDYRYELIDLHGSSDVELGALLKYAGTIGFDGFNVTHPYKQAIIPYLDGLSEDAAAIGAVNTVVRGEDGLFTGHNTDWIGYSELFRRSFKNAETDVVVQIGAGGAGAAVAYAHLKSGVARLCLADSDRDKAKRLTVHLGDLFGQERVELVPTTELSALIQTASGVVNTTPVGMKDYPGMPFPAHWLNTDQWLVDIIYMPLITELLAAARYRGIHAVGGSGMTVFQAAEALRLITGIDPDRERMYAHMKELLIPMSN